MEIINMTESERNSFSFLDSSRELTHKAKRKVLTKITYQLESRYNIVRGSLPIDPHFTKVRFSVWFATHWGTKESDF